MLKTRCWRPFFERRRYDEDDVDVEDGTNSPAVPYAEDAREYAEAVENGQYVENAQGVDGMPENILQQMLKMVEMAKVNAVVLE